MRHVAQLRHSTLVSRNDSNCTSFNIGGAGGRAAKHIAKPRLFRGQDSEVQLVMGQRMDRQALIMAQSLPLVDVHASDYACVSRSVLVPEKWSKSRDSSEPFNFASRALNAGCVTQRIIPRTNHPIEPC